MNGINGIAGSGIRGETALTEATIGAAYLISNELVCGFLEKVYENALAIELRDMGHTVDQQRTIEVRWRNEIAGIYQPDMIVDDLVIVELKVTRALEKVHWAQCMNYLRVANLEIALLLNFGLPRLEIQRVTSASIH